MEIRNSSKKYQSTATMVYSCQYHVIFTTKYRRNVLSDDVAKRLKELVTARQTDYQYEILEMEVMPDHVHLLIDVNPVVGIDSVIKKIKCFTAHALKKEFQHLRTRLPCLWTRSKFVSTVGVVSLETVKRYIADQKNK
jgi:putative transposase